jgi:hypothetical protein
MKLELLSLFSASPLQMRSPCYKIFLSVSASSCKGPYRNIYYFSHTSLRNWDFFVTIAAADFLKSPTLPARTSGSKKAAVKKPVPAKVPKAKAPKKKANTKIPKTAAPKKPKATAGSQAMKTTKKKPVKASSVKKASTKTPNSAVDDIPYGMIIILSLGMEDEIKKRHPARRPRER